MQLPCTRPRSVGFEADGKTICWSQKKYSKEYAPFQLPCGKCIECRLDYARQWAVRCVHEAQMHEKNSFITLTYSDENLKNPKLDYTDFQLFMKKLRKLQDEPIGMFVTGEYGEKTKRPHWHAILFNYEPRDAEYNRTTDKGDKIFTSRGLEKTWGLGRTEYGSVTFESAGYCARYAAKKLCHGQDGHDYEPISKKSSKHAIGKKWIEKYYEDVFNYGYIALKDGKKTSIPRYYEKWFKENHPEKWLRYVTEVKLPLNYNAEIRSLSEKEEWIEINNQRLAQGKLTFTDTAHQRREKVKKSKFKQLQAYLKL